MRYIRPVDIVLTVAVCIAAAAVVALVALEVVARYVFGTSIYFATELAQLCFVWTIFLGLPLALVRGRHVGITIVDSWLSPRLAGALRRLSMALSIALLSVITWKAWETMLFNWDQSLNTLPLSGGLFYLSFVIGAVASIYILLVGLFVGDYRLIKMADE